MAGHGGSPERVTMRRVLAVAAVLVVLAGCGSDDDEADTATTKATTTEATTTTEAASRCEDVPEALQQAIASGPEQLVDVTYSEWAAVRSEDYDEVWFIAATSSGDGSVAVWTTDALDGSGLVSAVNDTAQMLTIWPDNAGGSSMEDDGAVEAEECAST